MAVNVEPLRVSPFIKHCLYGFSPTNGHYPALQDSFKSQFDIPRYSFLSVPLEWSFLVAGIFYGMTRYEALSRKQKAIRDSYERDRPERQARVAAEKKRRTEEEMATLMEVLKVSTDA